MIRSSIAIAATALCLTGPAIVMPVLADDATPPDGAGGRYLFEKQADGFVRLDSQTGAVSLCSQRAVGFACVASPEDRAVLENEIARLRAENVALKKAILSRGLPLPPGVMPEAAAPSNELTVRLPSDADVDRMVAIVGRAWHRFVEAIERAQQQVFNKS